MPVVCLTKVSILLQLERIFIPDRRSHDYRIVQALIWLNVLFFTACFFLEVFSCVPREALWDPSVTGKCVNLPLSFIITAVINIVSDLSMLTLPMIWVWRLQMVRTWKLRISAVFATGILYARHFKFIRKVTNTNSACISSTMRLVESIRNNAQGADQTWTWTPVALW